MELLQDPLQSLNTILQAAFLLNKPLNNPHDRFHSALLNRETVRLFGVGSLDYVVN